MLAPAPGGARTLVSARIRTLTSQLRSRTTTTTCHGTIRAAAHIPGRQKVRLSRAVIPPISGGLHCGGGNDTPEVWSNGVIPPISGGLDCGGYYLLGDR